MGKVNPIPPGYHTVTASLVVRDGKKAIEFYKKAFGAQELGVMLGPNGGVMHAELKIGDTKIMLGDEFPDMGALSPLSLGGSPVSLNIYTEDCDALFNRAVSAGAKVTMPPADMFWGDRMGQVTDPFGQKWSISTRIKDMTPAEQKAAQDVFVAEMAKKKP